MEFPFWKMHGAANDFILVDDRDLAFPGEDHDWVEAISARRTGVGADGVILIQPSAQADFRMRFFNPDGHEVEMCGNGARCVARLAHELGVAPAAMRIDTVAGILRAEVTEGQVLLHMTTPESVALNQVIDCAGEQTTHHFANTGVPHVVVPVGDVAVVDIQRLGPALRYHEIFAPAGTNVNFVEVTGPSSLAVRTFERGVEAETLACGTGIVASAVTLGLAGVVAAPVQVTARSGDTLVVDFTLAEGRATDVTLFGPAEHVFQGALKYER